MPRPAADSSVFHAIADPTRRAILDLLRGRELSVSDLMTSLAPPAPPPRARTPRRAPRPAISQSAFSQHLAVLRRSGLVTSRKSGRIRYYRFNAAPLRQVADWIALYDAFWTEKLNNLGRFLDQRTGTPKEPS